MCMCMLGCMCVGACVCMHAPVCMVVRMCGRSHMYGDQRLSSVSALQLCLRQPLLDCRVHQARQLGSLWRFWLSTPISLRRAVYRCRRTWPYVC